MNPPQTISVTWRSGDWP